MNLRDEGIFNKIVTDIFGVQPSEIYYQELKDIIFTKSKEYYPDESRLLSDLDRIMRNRVSDVAITLGNKRPEFSFNDASEVRPIFDAILPEYENKVDSWWNSVPHPNEVDKIPNSYERIALTSMAYNQDDTKPLLVKATGKLLTAMISNNRPEAWYEIRYQSNGDKLPGVAKRRYYESQLFGLYDNANSVSEEEAKKVFAMYTKHRGKVKDYDDDYGRQVAIANVDFNYKVENFPEATAKARQVLINKYAPEKDSEIDEILVDLEGNGINRETNKKTSNALILGSSKDDIIRTGKGSNIVYGDDGNDIISSSTGSNSNELHGESGTDTYNFETLSGNNIINDSDGNGKIQIGNIILSGNANPKTDSNGNVIDGVWSFDSVACMSYNELDPARLILQIFRHKTESSKKQIHNLIDYLNNGFVMKIH